jgi:hypothetical protein
MYSALQFSVIRNTIKQYNLRLDLNRDMIVVVSAGYIVVYQKEYVGAEEYHQEIMSNFLTQYQ